MTEFSKNLYDVLCDKDMSQTELAVVTGYNQATLSRYLNGKREPKASTIKEIAVSLNVSADKLLGIEENNGTD